MGQKKHPFQRVLSLVASAGSNDLTTDPVDEGKLFCIQRVVVENETSDYTDLRIFASSGGLDHLIAEQDSPQAATAYWHTEDIYLSVDQYLVCRLSGCAADDVLKAYITGWFVRGREIGDNA